MGRESFPYAVVVWLCGRIRERSAIHLLWQSFSRLFRRDGLPNAVDIGRVDVVRLQVIRSLPVYPRSLFPMSSSAQSALFDESRLPGNGLNGTSGAFSVEASGRRLIVNADDLGMSQAISEAIFQGHLRGIVTSASLLVNFADSERAARRARELPEGVVRCPTHVLSIPN